METTSNCTLHCDKCGRPIGSKGYISINGWIICGICQWEAEHQKPPINEYAFPVPNIGIENTYSFWNRGYS